MRKSKIRESLNAFADMQAYELEKCGFKICSYDKSVPSSCLIKAVIETSLIRISFSRTFGYAFGNVNESMRVFSKDDNILIFSVSDNSVEWEHKVPKEMMSYLKKVLNVPINFRNYKEMLRVEKGKEQHKADADKLYGIFKDVKGD